MVEATVSLSYSDRLKAEWAVASSRVTALLWLSFFPACGVLLLALSGPSPTWLDRAMVVLCFGFVPVAFLFGAYRGYVAGRKNGPFVYRFTPDGFELKTRTAELKQTWAGVPRVRTKLDFLLVYINKKCAYCLPLRNVGSQDLASILEWASAGGAQRVGA